MHPLQGDLHFVVPAFQVDAAQHYLPGADAHGLANPPDLVGT